jgi:hypothetical protein
MKIVSAGFGRSFSRTSGIPTVDYKGLFTRQIPENFVFVSDLNKLLIKDQESGLWTELGGDGSMVFDGYAPVLIRYFTNGDDLSNLYYDIVDANFEVSPIDASVYNYYKTPEQIIESTTINLSDTISEDYYNPVNDAYAIEIVSLNGITTLKDFVPDGGVDKLIINCAIKLNSYAEAFTGKVGEIIGLENVDFSSADSLYLTFRYSGHSDFSSVNTSGTCTRYDSTFSHTTADVLDISGLNWDNADDLSSMFSYAEASHIVGTIDTRNASDKSNMFYSTNNLVSPTADEIDKLTSDDGALWTSEDGIIVEVDS